MTVAQIGRECPACGMRYTRRGSRLCGECPYKYCPRCQEIRARDEFTKNRASADGRTIYCHACRADYRHKPRPCNACGAQIPRELRHSRSCGRCGLKRCGSCKQAKPYVAFVKNASASDGHYSRCRSCEAHRRECVACGSIFTGHPGKHCGACGLRRCAACDGIKPESEFVSLGARAARNIYGYCKSCAKFRGRIATWERCYNLTVPMVVKLYEFQNGACAICIMPIALWADDKGLHVDHDYMTMIVRGLLCIACNTSSGFLDSEWLWSRAGDYRSNPPAVQALGTVRANEVELTKRLGKRVVYSRRYAMARSMDLAKAAALCKPRERADAATGTTAGPRTYFGAG